MYFVCIWITIFPYTPNPCFKSVYFTPLCFKALCALSLSVYRHLPGCIYLSLLVLLTKSYHFIPTPHFNYVKVSKNSKLGRRTIAGCTTQTDFIFILVINQFDAQHFCFTISLFHASTCFEHHVLIIRSKLYYTASGIITPIGGRPVHRLREDCARDGHL